MSKTFGFINSSATGSLESSVQSPGSGVQSPGSGVQSQGSGLRLQTLHSRPQTPDSRPQTLDSRPGGWVGWAIIAAIIAAIAGAEAIFAYRNVAHGIALSLGLVLTIYLIVSTLPLQPRIARVAEALALLPLYVLFTSSLPWFFLHQQYLLPAVYSLILGLCAWHIYQNGLSLREVGFRKGPLMLSLALGVGLAVPVGIGEYFILRPAPAFPSFEVRYFLRDLGYMLLFVGVGEEVLFRGILLQDLARALGRGWGIFLSSAAFAIMHLTWRSLPEVAFVFVVGILLALLFYRTRSLTAPIILHGVGNVVLVSVMPYLWR